MLNKSTVESPLFGNVADDIMNFFENGQINTKKVIDALNFSKKDVASAAQLSLSSIRYDNRIPAELIQRANEWAAAINLVANHFKDFDKTLLWFKLPNPLLGDVSPATMIKYGRYKKLISFIISSLEGNKN